MKLHPYLSLYSKIIFRWTKDLDFKFETSKVLEENVSSILQSVGVEMYCPNRTPFAQELRQTVDNWNLIKLKKNNKFCSTKETSEEEIFRMEENLCQLHISNRGLIYTKTSRNKRSN